MAISGTILWPAIQKALHNWIVACTGVAANQVIWGQQAGGRPSQPGIVLRLMNDNDHGMPWIDHETNYITFDDIVITSVDDVANTLTATAHDRLTGDGPVQLEGADLPLGLLPDVNYWVVKDTDDTFKLADGFVNAMNGVTIDLQDAGSGVMTLVDTTETLRAGQELTFIQRSLIKATLTVECYTDIGVGLEMASAILARVASRRLLPTPLQILEDANIGISEITRVRSYGGTQGNYVFEPRASMDVMLYLVSEASETGGIIERAEITDDNTGDTFTVDFEG
jgi:hypothetical protein